MSITKASAAKAADEAFKTSVAAQHKDENLLEAWARQNTLINQCLEPLWSVH